MLFISKKENKIKKKNKQPILSNEYYIYYHKKHTSQLQLKSAMQNFKKLKIFLI
ncbi:MAG: hypothetical protein RL607_2128 [Bacteroidota bacterium]